MNAYHAFALVYDRMMEEIPYEEWCNFVTDQLKQFGIINKIIYAINGDPQSFYEWLQIGCSEENDNCDPTPFQEFYVDTSEEAPIE